ncbi:TolC family protein [Algiphilus aromaticivorans]|uniref:TolC family protein n=1 Tax=Algiphilus aromaticivorans TaxID=382454 RepID=UPI0005C1A29E|nr:TolC family protein [Algiphilus aromaticivorans]
MRRALGSLALAGLAAGCATPMAPEVEQTLPQSERFTGDGEAPIAQCTQLGGTALQTLVASAFADSPTLAQAWARLRQARAAARAEGGTLLPSLSLSLQRSESSGDGATAVPPQAGGQQSSTGSGTWQSTAAARYELDFWGRLDSRREAARLSARAAEGDLRTAAISLAADTATAWADWVTSTRRVATLVAQAEDARALERLQALRFANGQSDALALEQARQQAASVAARLSEARGALDAARLRLELLLGQTPGAAALPEPPEALPAPGALPDAGLPGSLLDARPDLRAAWLRLQAADARAAAAAAERWPRLTLSANLFTQAAAVGDLFDRTIREVAAALDWSLFQGGALAARQAEAEAVAVERLFALEQAWLEALREVQAALDGERAARTRISELDAQIMHARQRLNLAHRRYAQGQLAYLEVLSAQQAVNSAELEALTARNARFLQRVNLCRGLAANVAGTPEPPALLRADAEESP